MNVRTTKLNNGLTIISETMPGLESSTIGVWVDAGARHETPARHGISHMLEHMAFKGTRRRSALRIAEEIEAVGGHLNAHTSHESTAYYARVLKSDVPLALDILADILQHSTFDGDELERERDVIVQEIGQALDTPDDLVFDEMMTAAYAEQPVGRPILGTIDTVTSFNRDMLSAYLGEHYRAPGMVLAAAGAVDHDRLVALAGEAFDGLRTDLPEGYEPARFTGGDRRKDEDLEQVHLTLAFEGVPYHDPDYYTAQVFSGVLGGGMSSRLFQEVREKRGLAYSVFAFHWPFADTGILGVYAGTSPGKAGELVPLLAHEINRLSADANEEETARARAQAKAGLLMSLESSSARAEQIARQHMIFGRILSTDEIVAQIDAVDAAAVRRFVRRVLDGPKPAIAAVGPISGLESYDRIAAKFS